MKKHCKKAEGSHNPENSPGWLWVNNQMRKTRLNNQRLLRMKKILCIISFFLMHLAHSSVVQFQLYSGNNTLGSFQVELYDQDKPETVSNFLHYVESGSYNNSFFERSVPGFIMQGGSYFCTSPSLTNIITTSNVKPVPSFGPIINEANAGNFYSNTNGTIAMALAYNNLNSAKSEFFLNLVDNNGTVNSTNLDGTLSYNVNLDDDSDGGPFTVFGRVISGWTNLESIVNYPIVNASGANGALVTMPIFQGVNGDIVQPPCNDLIYYSISVITGQSPVIPAVLKFSISPPGKTALLSWSTVLSEYVLQSTASLTPPSWASMTSSVPVIVSSNFTVTVTNTVTARFFRLYNTNTLVLPSNMALIPAGNFTMGDTFNEGYGAELPAHTVYVSAFEMDQYDVTLAFWQSVYTWATRHGYTFDNVGAGKAPNHPVQSVGWYDAVKWCNARSEIEGRTPAYYMDATQTNVYRSGDLDLSNAFVNWNAGYRLPTEAEWEKAARGGLSGLRFPWGNTISWTNANYFGDPLSLDPASYAYDLATAIGYDPAFTNGVNPYANPPGPYTSPVGYFPPNSYGLYDMVGDVWQWIWDWWPSTYSTAPQTDPRGAATGSDFRVIRGGFDALTCRNAYRDDNGLLFYNLNYNFNTQGFRCVRAPSP
jgi:formylglycine-generating enzyme required for sulfatase activity/cyclophilin family peptidyl-prolyl cis-trans isomerase